MNERTRELYVDAFQVFNKCDENYEEMFDKFAELIVGECMSVAQEYDGAKLGGPGLIIAMRIEQHFGVQE